MTYDNVQPNGAIYSTNLRVTDGGEIDLYAGVQCIQATVQRLGMEDLNRLRWGVKSHATSIECASPEMLRSSIDANIDILELISLIPYDEQGFIHIENLSQVAVLNIWRDDQFLGALACRSYAQRAGGVSRQTDKRVRVKLPLQMLSEFLTFARVTFFSRHDAALRVSSAGVVWICSECPNIHAVCSTDVTISPPPARSRVV